MPALRPGSAEAPDDEHVVVDPAGLHFPSPTEIALSMPWGGEVTLPVPPPAVVVLTGPRE